MEIGSLSGVVAADLAEADDPAEWARRLLSATITEGLAVMATRQHVKAWRGELTPAPPRGGVVSVRRALEMGGTASNRTSTRSERRRLLDLALWHPSATTTAHPGRNS